MSRTPCAAFLVIWFATHEACAQFSGLSGGMLSGYLDTARLSGLPGAIGGSGQQQSTLQAGSSFGLAKEAVLGGFPSNGMLGVQQEALPGINPGIGMAQGGGAAPNIAQLQAQAVQDPRLDQLCPGKARSSTDVGRECWKKIWEMGGCKAENAPEYEHWHQIQSLEVLMADVVQWAHLPDERHRQACYGSAGPPEPVGASLGAAEAERPVIGGREHRSRFQASAPAISRPEELAALVQEAGTRPVVLEFWSEACGFCSIMFPVFELLAEKYRGRAFFRTVDAQIAPEIVSLFQLYGLPAFKSVLNGQVFQEVEGADTAGLERLVEAVVNEADRQDPGAVTSTNKELSSTGADGEGHHQRGFGDRQSEVQDLGDSQLVAEMQALQKEFHRRQMAKANSTANFCAEARAVASSDLVPVEQVVVLGGGPAGLSAALYAARAGLCPVVVAPTLGGQLMAKGVNVENYPGLSSTRGAMIIQDMRAQALSFFADLRQDVALSVDLSRWPFALRLNSSEQLHAQSLIVATGADSRWLGVKGEDELRGFGVSSCAACDGPLFWDKRCAVIGGGDTAMEEALLLARICASVTVIHRRSKLRAGHLLQQRVLSNQKVKFLWNSEVQEFVVDQTTEGFGGTEKRPRLNGILLRDVQIGLVSRLDADAAFVAIGHDPNTKMFHGQLQMRDATSYLETFNRSSQTSVPGVFAAGDVADPTYRQAVTSAGSGAMAAMDAERWLSMQDGTPAALKAHALGTLRSEM